MFDRFTDRARKIMGFARQEAMKFSHQYIGTEHILLGMIEEGSGVAANVLRNLNVDPEKLRVEIVEIVGRGPTMVTMGQLPFTPGAKRSLELSSEAAQGLRHNYIGTEHLLLGLMREGEGAGALALVNMGLDAQIICAEVMELLGADLSSVTEAPSDPDYEELVRAEAPHFFDRYQEWTRETAIYPGAKTGSVEARIYLSLKSGGENGEFQEKIGKLIRDRGGFAALESLDDGTLKELAKELGDELWYLARRADEFGFKLSDIAAMNIKKLTSRKDRNVLHGSGDNR